MAITRADIVINGRAAARENYSDFVNSFAKTPYGNQLGKVTNVESINQSLKNLLFTNLGERPFQPLVGCQIYNMLFEMDDDVEVETIRFFIENTIKNNEPRVNLEDVSVISDPDYNSFSITIVYSLINNSDPITLSFILKRVR